MVHEVKTKKYPEITDDFAKGLNLPGVTDVKTLEKHVKDDINNKKVSQAKDKQFNDILKAIVDDAKVVVAPQVIASETAAVKKDMVNQIQQNGLSFDQYKEITGLNDAQLEEQFQSEAKARLTQFLVLNKIGEVEKLVVAPNEIQDYYANLAKTYGMKVEEVEKALKPQESKLREQLIQGKIEKFVIANNTKEEKPAAKKADSKKTEDKKAAK